MPSFGKKQDLQQQIDMLEGEFVGQLRLKFVHAVLNVLLRRGIATEVVYEHFRALWSGHGDILIETLDTRWLVSACDTISDYSTDTAESQVAILISLFVATIKLSETERLISEMKEGNPEQIVRRTPLFDGLTAFMPGGGDMPANLMRRLEKTLCPNTLTGIIGREVISRMLCADTVFSRLAKHQTRNHWRPYLEPVSAPPLAAAPVPACAVTTDKPGYILLNDTSRLGENFHLGTAYACASLRDNLARRGLQEIGWANDRQGFDAMLSKLEKMPDLVVLNGEGTLHHGAKRAQELLSLCADVKERGIRVAVLNSVWEANTEPMVTALRTADLIHLRDSFSRKSLQADVAATVTPDMSIPMFMEITRNGSFPPPQVLIGIMDSVVSASSNILLNFAEEEGLPFYAMPASNLRILRASVAARSGRIRPHLLQMTDVMGAQAWLTGRFHGLIAALCAGLPVCSMTSNTSKIEGLLNDAGIADACLLDKSWMVAPIAEKREILGRRLEMQKTRDFIQRRDHFLNGARQQIDEMFDKTAALVLGTSPTGPSF